MYILFRYFTHKDYIPNYLRVRTSASKIVKFASLVEAILHYMTMRYFLSHMCSCKKELKNGNVFTVFAPGKQNSWNIQFLSSYPEDASYQISHGRIVIKKFGILLMHNEWHAMVCNKIISAVYTTILSIFYTSIILIIYTTILSMVYTTILSIFCT